MDECAEDFRRLFLDIFHRHNDGMPLIGEHDPDLAEIYDQIRLKYRPISRREEFESLLPSDTDPETDSLARKQFLYLLPVEKGRKMLPVLAVKYKFRYSHARVSLRVMLFVLDNRRELKALGMRFEGIEGEGIHDYYHAQLIVGFEKGAPIPSTLQLVPTTQPAFPIDAKCPVTLLMALMITLYGKEELGKLLQSGVAGNLKKYASSMNLRILESERPSYYVLRLPTGKKIYCHSWAPKDVVSKQICDDKRTRISGIDRTQYLAAPDEDRRQI